MEKDKNKHNLKIVLKQYGEDVYRYWLVMGEDYLMTVVNGTVFSLNGEMYTVEINQNEVNIHLGSIVPGDMIKNPKLIPGVMKFSFEL